MVFIPDHLPPVDDQLDPPQAYIADTPQALKQATVTPRRHRWFQPVVIGVPSGPYTYIPGLTAGLTQRVQFDHKPDWIMVSISGQTANTGRVNLFLGDPGGPPIPLGPHGKAVVPAPQSGVITLVNVGSTPTYGVIVAHAGYVDAGVDIECGD